MPKEYDPIQNTVLQYLNYIFLRTKNNYVVSEDEEKNTYEYYKKYCKDNGVEPFTYSTFFRELVKYGFESKQQNSVDVKGARVRKRNFSFKNLYKLLYNYTPINYSIHTDIVEIGGEQYQMVIKFIKLKQKIKNNSTATKISENVAKVVSANIVKDKK